jgi:hypothetical protein
MAQATHSGPAQRASMRATSTLLLAAQLATLGHLLIVRHTICPEHGETIHSGVPGGTLAPRLTNEGTPADPVLGAGAPPAECAHDHCLARANTRERFALLPALDSKPDRLLLAAVLPSLSAVDAAPAVAVLLLAPKNSPPLA